jgi:hypothetical protein
MRAPPILPMDLNQYSGSVTRQTEGGAQPYTAFNYLFGVTVARISLVSV